MPKIVDHEARRKEIADVTWQVIRRDGLDKASIRNIAKEADMSVGSIRHYFEDQDELLSFSMKLVSERVRERIKGLKLTGDPKSDIERLVLELVPVDDERRTEAQVWASFTGRTITDPAVRALSQEVHDSIAMAFRMIMTKMEAGHLLKEGVVPELEIMRFQALVDGLAVHGVTRPEKVTTSKIKKVVSYHLDSIMSQE